MKPLTIEQARAIAAVDYPEHPRGIGAPCCTGVDPWGPPKRLTATALYEDPQGRGVWLEAGPGHLIPCPRR